ncbi:hypothetical protein VTN02DRAFT_1112 [Thermoascus thermophilus]
MWLFQLAWAVAPRASARRVTPKRTAMVIADSVFESLVLQVQGDTSRTYIASPSWFGGGGSAPGLPSRAGRYSIDGSRIVRAKTVEGGAKKTTVTSCDRNRSTSPRARQDRGHWTNKSVRVRSGSPSSSSAQIELPPEHPDPLPGGWISGSRFRALLA